MANGRTWFVVLVIAFALGLYAAFLFDGSGEEYGDFEPLPGV